MDTRLGTIYLYVPKLRKGGYVPFFISERRRSEQALIAVVQKAFINGVSTRKIERLARAMGIKNISASQVSEFNKELEAQMEEIRTRPLGEEYSIFWIDALYQRVWAEGRVVSVALMIACGVNKAGAREIYFFPSPYGRGRAQAHPLEGLGGDDSEGPRSSGSVNLRLLRRRGRLPGHIPARLRPSLTSLGS